MMGTLFVISYSKADSPHGSGSHLVSGDSHGCTLSANKVGATATSRVSPALSANKVRATATSRICSAALVFGILCFTARAADQATVATLASQGCSRIVFALREVGSDPHWYANFSYAAHDPNAKYYRAAGRLCLLDVTSGVVTLLVDDPRGTIRDPVVHYDAAKVLFSWRKADTDVFHLFEMNLDGTGLRQITDGPFDDIEPCYLPDGGIVFCSGRCKRWVNCWLSQVAVIYRCDEDGGNVRQLSANIEQDNTPWVLPDGRILYTRWEYIDRSQVHYHHLWTMNPDGSGQMVFFGNMNPDNVYIDAKPIRGSENVVLIFSPGHGATEHRGYIADLSNKRGPDAIESLRTISGGGYRDPFALDTNVILAACGRRLVMLEATGAVATVYDVPASFGAAELHEPRPVIVRQREAALMERVDYSCTTGIAIVENVYAGRNMQGVRTGEIAKLLVIEALPKPINYTGGMEPLTYGGSFTLERMLGTVPVAADGSACMELPANRSLFFVALDARDRSVKRMQSFCTVMQGERVGCVGCHEPRTRTPPTCQKAGALEAATHDLSTPIPVADMPDVFEFPRDIQPILDRHCVRCHSPAKREGAVVLTGDRWPLYSHSFYTLSVRNQIADGRNLPKSNYAPRMIGDVASPLMKKLDGSHHNVRVTDLERRTVSFWINTGAPYPGTYAALGCGMIGGYAVNAGDRQDLAWPSVQAAQDVLKRRCVQCHQGPLTLPDSPSADTGVQPWTAQYGNIGTRLSRHIVYNLTRPDQSALLLAPLARNAGGWGMARHAPTGGPPTEIAHVFASTDDPDYRVLLASIVETKKKLDKIKRFDMPGFKPRADYVREMQRYGVLPSPLDPAKPIDVYATDRAYWSKLEEEATAPQGMMGNCKLKSRRGMAAALFYGVQ